jgi:hypothetical protein
MPQLLQLQSAAAVRIEAVEQLAETDLDKGGKGTERRDGVG